MNMLCEEHLNSGFNTYSNIHDPSDRIETVDRDPDALCKSFKIYKWIPTTPGLIQVCGNKALLYRIQTGHITLLCRDIQSIILFYIYTQRQLNFIFLDITMDYDKLFPRYVRVSGCYLDILPRDITNIVYEYKYDGANVIYDDIVNYRLMKDGKNIIEDISEQIRNTDSLDVLVSCVRTLMKLLKDFNSKRESIRLREICYLMTHYVALYKLYDVQPSGYPNKLPRVMIDNLTKYDLSGLCIVKYYQQVWINRANEIIRILKIED
jgi:hypothetical protein